MPRATRASMVQRTVCSVVISQSNYLFLNRRLKTALSVKCQFLHQWDSGSLKKNLIHLLFHGHDYTLCCVCQVDFDQKFSLSIHVIVLGNVSRQKPASLHELSAFFVRSKTIAFNLEAFPLHGKPTWYDPVNEVFTFVVL